MRLEGKRAVITGASAGIGAATAEALCELGCGVVLGARRLEKLEAFASDLRKKFPEVKVEARALDVDSVESAERFAKETLALGQVDILVNNAGLARGLDPISAGDEPGWKEVLDTNVLGLLRTTRLFLPPMEKRGAGHVVNMGSVAGSDFYAGGAVYCATKAAVYAISQSLRHELHGSGVRVTCIEPGLVETDFSVVRFRGDKERAKKPYQGVTPLTARDVAECVAFAVSRPPHVDLDRLVILATAQVGATKVARKS